MRAAAVCPQLHGGRIRLKPESWNNDIIGGLDFMATFAAFAGVTLPTEDLEGKPMIFDSYDMSPVLFGTGPCPRNEWYYFTEDELLPGAIRIGQFKMVFNLRGDDGAQTGGMAACEAFVFGQRDRPLVPETLHFYVVDI